MARNRAESLLAADLFCGAGGEVRLMTHEYEVLPEAPDAAPQT